MNSLTFNSMSYVVDGRPFYLYSGDLHYFRVPRSDWKTRMELLRAAGGNCVATYIPWIIHEPQEGRFEFRSDDGRLNLEEFLELANSLGLYVIAKPGPHQYSELINGGLPSWLIDQYPQILARNVEGEIYNGTPVSYIHPLFLEKVQSWFNQVCPILARQTLSRGGPVAFTQIDNELTGIQIWSGGLDYHPESMGFGTEGGRYPEFLMRRYRDISPLNSSYGTGYSSFTDVRPKGSGLETPGEIRRAKDYFDFYLSTIGDYARILRDMMKAHGIDTPFFHNSANPEMNCFFIEIIETLGRDFLLGSDHYYNLSQAWSQNNPTPQYAVRMFYSLETLRLMGFPATVMEMPSGSLSDWPPITPQDAAACYRTHLAFGAKGINFYIFSGGANPPGVGGTSDIYDYSAPIGPQGEVRPLYRALKDVGAFLAERPWFAGLRREYDFRCLLNMEYPRAWNYWKTRGELTLTNSEAHEFMLKGLLTSAFCAGLSPALCRAGRDDWVDDVATPLVAISSASMSEKIQKQLVRFLENGGKLLLVPTIPVVDEALNPCTLLSDFLGGPRIVQQKKDRVRIDVGEVLNIFNTGEVFPTETLPGRKKVKVMGKNALTGQPLVWSLETPGGGQVIFMGIRWSHAMREHERMLTYVLEELGLKQKIKSSNPNVWTSLQTDGHRSVLSLINLFTAPMETQVEFFPEGSASPIVTGRHIVEGMSVTILEYVK